MFSICQLKKKKHTQKAENYVLFSDLEDYSSGYNLSESSENCSKEVNEEPRYIAAFAENKHAVKHQKITLIPKIRYLKLMI